jgi:hypothetical protein
LISKVDCRWKLHLKEDGRRGDREAEGTEGIGVYSAVTFWLSCVFNQFPWLVECLIPSLRNAFAQMRDVAIAYYSAPPSCAQFCNDHLAKNEPALFGPSLTASWPCRAEWTLATKETSAGSSSYSYPNLDLLEERYGHLSVPVEEEIREGDDDDDETQQPVSTERQVCGPQTRKTERRQRLLRDVLARWRRDSDLKAYVKDWHLAQELDKSTDPNKRGAHFYSTPDVFANDWMNSFYRAKVGDDFRFVARLSIKSREQFIRLTQPKKQ